MSRVSKGVLFAIALLLLLAAPAWAGPQVLSWDVIPFATSYGVEQSVDSGVTWVPVTLPAEPICAVDRCTTTVTAPTTGVVLYRMWAANAVGRGTRFTAGLWVCESCTQPPPAVNLGVK